MRTFIVTVLALALTGCAVAPYRAPAPDLRTQTDFGGQPINFGVQTPSGDSD